MQLYKERRQKLINKIKEMHASVTEGAVLFFGAFENERTRFRQESSFYYFTGIEEPACVLRIDLSGKSIVYVPCYAQSRAQWVTQELTENSAKSCGVDEVRFLGNPIQGYALSPLFNASMYSTFIQDVMVDLKKEGVFFTISAPSAKNVEQIQHIARLEGMIPGFTKALIDVSGIIGQLRRKKSQQEIELLYKAVELTMIAQHGAAGAIGDGQKESAIQAGIEYVFTEGSARTAFPSIVGSGKNSTVLHYNENNGIMRTGDLVVIDIGAEYNYYCADITRTYPVSGVFSKRQKELYNLVLETQDLIASKAKPGMWLKNKQYQDQSLHHIAQAFLDKKGYGDYFVHGIGHYLGLDVHDVGSYEEPLEEGDVITIEPGIYIPAERIGIRIEDDYWLVKNGNECLSYELVKDVQGIEELAQSTLDDEYEEDVEDFD